MENDDIALWPYVAAILRRWRLILTIALLGMIAGLIISMIMPKTYQATSAIVVLIRQTGSQVGAPQPLLNIETIDVGSRRQGILALAESDVIEAQLPSATIDQVAPPSYKPGKLVKSIEATLDGDLLTISARAASPDQAKILADTWATTFIAYAQPLFADRHTELRLAGNAIVPYAPSSPNVIRYTLVGLLAGLTLGVIFAVIAELTGFKRLVPLHGSHRESPVQSPSPIR